MQEMMLVQDRGEWQFGLFGHQPSNKVDDRRNTVAFARLIAVSVLPWIALSLTALIAPSFRPLIRGGAGGSKWRHRLIPIEERGALTRIGQKRRARAEFEWPREPPREQRLRIPKRSQGEGCAGGCKNARE
jgi:hypothetical protein